jgi:NADH:ubiquinone oxidoreductase subunit E
MFLFDQEENREKIEEFIAFMDKNREMDGALLPVLQEAQNKFGYIPEEIVELISSHMQILTSTIYGVATFYSQFSFVPRGKYSISVCMGTACYVKGATDILEEFSKVLGIGLGETTPDRKFSIVETRCVGLCSDAPVVMINNQVYTHFKRADVDHILSILG